LPLERNGGFASANNAILRQALSSRDPPDFVYLLNPDTVVRPGALRALLDVLEHDPRIGIAGSALESPAGVLECAAHQMIRPLSELVQGARLHILTRLIPRYVVSPPCKPLPHACEWVSGAAMMIRRKVLDDIGLLDDKFFLYFDEVDYCFRALSAGWQIWHVPQSRVLHREGASTGIREPGRRPQYWYDSRRRFFVKSYGVAGLILADLCWAVGRLSLHLRRLLRLGGTVQGDPRWLSLDILWGDAKAIVTGQAFRIVPREQR
jgi:GT2 family glycosyltransferase